MCCMEPNDKDYVEYYGPKDFKIGATINVFGRRFLIYNMDEFTKQWYRENFGYTDFTPICIEVKKPEPPKVVSFIVKLVELKGNTVVTTELLSVSATMERLGITRRLAPILASYCARSTTL